ncbi:MAG TPA: ABC transporter substrate-binding protein [Patescibacteria group bacterium]|nr:ABC transporter substrate-binding protein [Patescibacteria group bacterium]
MGRATGLGSNQRRLLWLVSALLVLTLCAGCGGQTEKKAATKAETKKLSIGILKLTSSAPLFIGLDKGFFKEEGIDLEPQWFEAAQPIAVATAANKVDIGATGITASLYNMVAGGQELTIVADKGREQKGYSSSALLVRSDLWEQGVRKVEDLKGKKIGITQSGSTFHYMAGRLLESNGLVLSDTELVPLGKISSLMAALQSKQVDAVILNEPNIAKVVADGYGKIMTPVGDAMEYQTSGIFFSPALTKDKGAAVRFMKAYIKACRYYYDAVLVQKDGKAVPGANFEEVVGIIAKYTGASADEVRTGLPYMDRDGALLTRDIQTQIDWYAAHKMIDKKIDAARIVNTSFEEEALKQLQ